MTAVQGTTNDTIMKADRRGRLRYSPEQRITLLKAYQACGLSGPRFAALHGVKYPTLANWIQKSKQADSRPKGRRPLRRG
jgi:transposase-like protein